MRKPKTDFGEIADARINNKLDFSRIHNKKDYKEAVKDLLKNTPTYSKDDMARNKYCGQNLLYYLEELYEQSNAETKIYGEIREVRFTIRVKTKKGYKNVPITRYRNIKTGRFTKKQFNIFFFLRSLFSDKFTKNFCG